eukprot:scaffold49315_cov35-Prasinocladus_malaysianus.AAC.1
MFHGVTAYQNKCVYVMGVWPPPARHVAVICLSNSVPEVVLLMDGRKEMEWNDKESLYGKGKYKGIRTSARLKSNKCDDH